MKKTSELEKGKINSEDSCQDNRKNENAEAVKIAKSLRRRSQLRRHLANPSVFPKPIES